MGNSETTFLCPTCGSTQGVESGNHVKCSFCGNQYRKKLQNEPVYADLAYAVNERQEADFDKARRRYDALIDKYKTGSGMEEAYWGRFLCEQYVIFYHNDRGEAVPSFWNINNEPCHKSSNYQRALKFAEYSGNRENYENLANLIEEYKEKYRRIKKEFPQGSDIFICFKDAGTDDANLGYKIYNKFAGKYHIFFSRESLNNISGNDYEPYIYHALTTAKIMIVLCSDRDRLESKWVHNEWWRFWKFSQTKEKTIIPVLRENFDAARLPTELGNCQAHKEDVDLLSVLSEHIDAILKNDGSGIQLTSFERELNIVNAAFETDEVDEAKIRIRELLEESMDRSHDHISALLLHAKIYSNNYRHLNNEHAANSISHAEEIARAQGIAIEDMSEYRCYRAAVARKRIKGVIAALLIVAFLGIGSLFVWNAMQDTSVKNLSNSKYHAIVEAEDNRFEFGTEFQVSEVQADNLMKNEIRLLPIDQSSYHLYDMELWRYGAQLEVEGNITVTLPLPSGIDADHAVIYYMSGDTPEKISSRVSDGNISFTTNHFSIYMIAEETTDCNHIVVTDRAIMPTCMESGLTEGQHCSLCKETLVEQKVVPAKGHKPGQAANCTESQYCTVCYVELASALGHKSGAEATCIDAKKCTVCHLELAPAKGHKPSPASCTDAQMCTVCHLEIAPAKGHAPGKAATCTEAQYCMECRAVLAVEKGHTPGTAATCTKSQVCAVCNVELKKPLGHKPGVQATCVDGQKCTVCLLELVPAKGHVPYGEATCTNPSTCSVCYAELEPAKGHTPGTEATCTEAQYCTVCHHKLADAKGHTPGESATCTAAQTCKACNAELEAATGHRPGAAATCTSAQFCTVCNLELEAAKGHIPGAEATCANAQICTVCNVELVAAKDHKWTVVPECLPTYENTGLTEGEQCSVCKVFSKEQQITVLVVFDSGEDGEGLDSKIIVLGSEYGELPVLEKQGYSFGGWYLDNFKIENSTKLETPHSHTLKPNWTVNRYSIRYDTNGGSGIDDSVYDYHAVTNSPDENPLRQGYNFIGWNFYNADTGEAIDFSYGNQMPSYHIKAVAQWAYKSIDRWVIDNENKTIDASYTYHLDYFDISDFAVFMNDNYTFHFVIRVYMKEMYEGYQEIELANSNNMILGGFSESDNYCYGGGGKQSTAGWSDSISVNVSGEHCSSKMHMVYGAHGKMADDWERQQIEVSLTISKK